MSYAIDDDAPTPMPGSPPGLSTSRSSKSSSLHSSHSSEDNESVLTDITHFEDITLDDEERAELQDTIHEPNFKAFGSSHDPKLPIRRSSRRGLGLTMPRELTLSKTRTASPQLPRVGHVRHPTGDGHFNGLSPGVSNPYLKRGFSSPVLPTVSTVHRVRSVSPSVRSSSSSGGLAVSPVALAHRLRRGSWQSQKGRKTIKELEAECDQDDGDDLPDDILLENVPMSPRPMSERRFSQSSVSDSNTKKDKVKTKVKLVGNGTPAIPVAQGCLRSPLSTSRPSTGHRGISMGQFPISHDTGKQPRAKSWTAALLDLNPESKALTRALEEHADEQLDRPKPQRSVSLAPFEKRRVQSSIAELPPLRTRDVLVDPLPISKEKEAVLSRTRPSWLPPKNPLEEKKHLREYQRMMVSSLEAEKKREADRRCRETHKDNTASSLLRIWEEHVMPNWDKVIPMKRTRELWWRGISPRSRGAVWQRAVGNGLGLSDASYEAALQRAKSLEKKLSRGTVSADEQRQGKWLASIRSDAASTFPELQIFQAGGPLHDNLIDVVMAYCMYRVDVGYVSGMTTIVALLLLNLPSSASTFITLCNVLNRSLPNAFLTHDPMTTSRYLNLAMTTLNAKIPTLSKHLNSPQRPTISLSTQPDLYMNKFFTSLFTQHLDLESMTRLWDVYVFEGDAVLVRAAVALFTCTESRLYGCDTREDVIAVLQTPDVVTANGGVADHERWMRAVRDAGRGTKVSAQKPSSTTTTTPVGLGLGLSPALVPSELLSPSLSPQRISMSV